VGARIRFDRRGETRLSGFRSALLSRLIGNASPKAARLHATSSNFKETEMSTPSIVGISGSLSDPSRTSVLVKHVLRGLERETGYTSTFIELSQAADSLFAVRSPYDVNEQARAFIDQVERADLLVVGTPVYRASYTGALKHLFDLVDHKRFSNKPVVLTATGGTPLHGLMIDHQLRPLFGFLNALTLPTTVYAVEADFADYELTNPAVLERIERVSSEASAYLTRRISTFTSPKRVGELAATA
jgi:FMN reductase